MTERPILFSGPMVCAILAGTKTQTRRVVMPQPDWIESSGRWRWPVPKSKVVSCTEVVTASREWWEYLLPEQCSYATGDRLWVRETWRVFGGREYEYQQEPRAVQYRADILDAIEYLQAEWRPSIFMPRWACRLVLEVVAVRVERLQDISTKDAIAEGSTIQDHARSKEWFFTLWDSLNAKRGYGCETNPWVWVIEFQRAAP
jgi:hypothetical protein